MPGPIAPATKRSRPSPLKLSAASRANSAARLLISKARSARSNSPRVTGEPPKLLARGRFGGVGVWSGVGELVAVGWPTPEEAALDGGLGGHRGADPSFDTVAFPFAHPPIQVHDDLMRVRARVDRTSDFG